MAKYVCDFSEVSRVGDELSSLAEELKACISNYDAKIKDDLSSWNGSAKSSFVGQCSAQVAIANSNAELLNELGNFIKSSAMSIQQTDDELTSISI